MIRAINFLFILTIIFTVSCSSPTDKKTNSEIKIDTKKTTNSSLIVDSSSVPEKVDSPSSLFLEMTNYLDSSGYSFDTTRLKKVHYRLQNKNGLVFADKYFYKIVLPDHSAFDTVEVLKGYSGIDIKTIKKDLLKKAKGIFAYFYCEKIKTDEVVRDGVIEEWQFHNEEDAEKAGLELNRIRNFTFFYTASYVTRTKNNVYVFHNRAAFNRVHQNTIKHFYKLFDVVYPQNDYPKGDQVTNH